MEWKKCWHYPERDAVAITNLGAVIDLDTYVCQACLDKIVETWGEDKIVKRL